MRDQGRVARCTRTRPIISQGWRHDRAVSAVLRGDSPARRNIRRGFVQSNGSRASRVLYRSWHLSIRKATIAAIHRPTSDCRIPLLCRPEPCVSDAVCLVGGRFFSVSPGPPRRLAPCKAAGGQSGACMLARQSELPCIVSMQRLISSTYSGRCSTRPLVTWGVAPWYTPPRRLPAMPNTQITTEK